MTRIVLVALFSALTSFNALADTLKSEQEAKQLSEKAMAQAAKGDFSAAFETIKPYVVFPESEFQTMVLQSKSQREQFGARFGKSVGYEFISEKKAGESVLRLTYIEKTEKTALPWMFIYYKTQSGWILNGIFWNDRILNVFDQ